MASQTTTLYDQQNVFSSAYTSATTGGIQNRTTDDGKLRCIVDSFTTTSAVTASSQTITLCKLPRNAKVVSLELIVPASVGTSSAKIGTFNINADGTLGAAITDNRYGSGVDLSTAGRKQFVIAAADSDNLTPAGAAGGELGNVAIVLSPVTTNFATAILFSWIILYTLGN